MKNLRRPALHQRLLDRTLSNERLYPQQLGNRFSFIAPPFQWTKSQIRPFQGTILGACKAADPAEQIFEKKYSVW